MDSIESFSIGQYTLTIGQYTFLMIGQYTLTIGQYTLKIGQYTLTFQKMKVLVPEVFAVTHVPGGGMTDNASSVCWFRQHGVFPETGRQGR